MGGVSDYHRDGKLGYKLDSKLVPHPSGIVEVTFTIKLDAAGGTAVADLEKELTKVALKSFDGNLSAVSRALGVSKRTIQNWVRRFSLFAYISERSAEIRRLMIEARNRPNR